MRAQRSLAEEIILLPGFFRVRARTDIGDGGMQQSARADHGKNAFDQTQNKNSDHQRVYEHVHHAARHTANKRCK